MPSLYDRATWVRVQGKGDRRGRHVRFKIAHDEKKSGGGGGCGTEVWVGLGEDMGLEGGLYTQGNLAYISLEGGRIIETNF